MVFHEFHVAVLSSKPSMRLSGVNVLVLVLVCFMSLIGLIHQVSARPPKCSKQDLKDKKYLDHCVQSCPNNNFNFVCGKDGVTYQNQCYLDRYHCEIHNATDNPNLWVEHDILEVDPDGLRRPCRKHKKNTKCPIMCPVNIEFPACDGTGKVYLNPCQLKKETCGRQGIGVFHPEFHLCQQVNIDLIDHPNSRAKYLEYFPSGSEYKDDYSDY